jgi:RNA polymerase-binding protein DksA
MDKNFIEERKKDLLERKENLEKQLSSFAKKNPENGNDYQTKWTEFGEKEDDNISEVENFESNINLEDTLETSLSKVNIALKKIEEGKYGVCDKCGKPIEEGRLKVFPSATACMQCKKLNL